jgi:hypothetical protein
VALSLLSGALYAVAKMWQQQEDDPSIVNATLEEDGALETLKEIDEETLLTPSVSPRRKSPKNNKSSMDGGGA